MQEPDPWSKYSSRERNVIDTLAEKETDTYMLIRSGGGGAAIGSIDGYVFTTYIYIYIYTSATSPPTPVRPAETSVAPRQSEGFLGTRDYLLSSHRPTRYHDNTSAHDIYTSKTIYDVNL